jgi:hypothetical protein
MQTHVTFHFIFRQRVERVITPKSMTIQISSLPSGSGMKSPAYIYI